MPSVTKGPTVYESPCECGRSVVVTAGQAGSQVDCECGKLVEIPTIRELRRNSENSAASDKKVAMRGDGRASQDEFSRKAVSVLGLVLLIVGLTIFGSLYLFQRSLNQEIDPRFQAWFDEKKQEMDTVPPGPLWDEWKMARDGGLGEHHPLEVVVNKKRAQGAWYGAYFGLAASGLGVLLLVFSALVPRRKTAA